MALDFGRALANASRTPAQNQEQRPQTQFWMNIGIVAADGTFVALPVGLPLDTMEKRVIRGSNKEWNDLQSASNALLDFILEGAKTLGAGEETLANGLSIQIKRVKADAGETPVNENPLLAGFAGLSFTRNEPEDEPEETGARRKRG